MILINRQVNNHYSMGGTHFLQTGYLLLNRNAPLNKDVSFRMSGQHQKTKVNSYIMQTSLENIRRNAKR